jgi:hypothetical protein
MKQAILFASLGIASGLLLTNMYTSIVDVPAWGHNIPESINTARQYFSVSNPGNFFRIFSPLNQLLGLLALILFWKQGKQVRLLLAVALVMYFIGEGMTFKYFYPRNEILFTSNVFDEQVLRETWEQWRSMNWVRSTVIAIGIVASSTALHFAYTTKPLVKKNLINQKTQRVAVTS